MSGLPGTIKLKALKQILKPLARFCLRGSYTLREFHELAKVAFVEAAVEEIERSEERVNVSRISLLSGVHRQDVNQIYRENREPLLESADLISKLISQWESNPKFLTKNRKPRALTAQGEASEFTDLVRTHNSHIYPGTVLSEMQRRGLIKKAGNKVKLIDRVPFLHGDPEKAFALLARGIETLIAVVEENVQTEGELRNLHLQTEYDNIFIQDTAAVRAWLIEEGKAFHKRAREFFAEHDKDINADPSKEGGGKVVLLSIGFSDGKHGRGD